MFLAILNKVEQIILNSHTKAQILDKVKLLDRVEMNRIKRGLKYKKP